MRSLAMHIIFPSSSSLLPLPLVVSLSSSPSLILPVFLSLVGFRL